MISEIIGYSAFIMGFVVCVLSLYYAHRYHKFQWSFVFLGLSYFGYATAEYLWYRWDIVGNDAYGSIADLAYVWYFIFGILHVFVMLTYFQKCGIRTILVVSLGSVALSMFYVVPSLGAEMFEYGMFFSAMASILEA